MEGKAWEILTKEEQTALVLSKGHDKSSWEAGGIMEKAHYKYLEIEQRATYFWRIFTSHFERHDNRIFPSGVLVPNPFHEYITLAIEQRLKPGQVIEVMDDNSYIVPSYRDRMIAQEIRALEASKDERYQHTVELIKDFDRWNNFRILPKEVQEISAYKRRQKTKNLKQLKNYMALPEFSLMHLRTKMEAKSKVKYYVPFLTPYYDDDYYVMGIKGKMMHLDELSSHGFYVFTEEDDAEQFAFIIANFMKKKKRHCKDGQKFWPKFRALQEISFNYREVQNIVPSRSYIESALGVQGNVRKKRSKR